MESPLLYQHPQIPMMNPGDETFTRSDEPTIIRLCNMARELKTLDETWRQALSARPNANEQMFYTLILAHVCSDIFLFHHENNLRLPRPPEDEVEWIVKEVRDRASTFDAILIGENMNISGEKEDEIISSKDTSHNLFSSWPKLDVLIQNLFQLRDSICALPRGSNEDALEISPSSEFQTNCGEVVAKKVKEIAHSSEREIDSGQSIEMGLDGGEADAQEVMNLEELLDSKTPEQALGNILWGLTCRRRERSYAPPVGEELKCYREIRKWVSSTISFVKAKADWLWNWGEWWGEAKSGNDFAAHRLEIKNDGEFINDSATFIKQLFDAPKGHHIAATFDELPEFRSLLNNWKERFSKIVTARFHGEKSIDLVKRDVNGRKRARVLEECEAKKKRKHNINNVDDVEVSAQSCRPALGNDMLMTNNQIPCLNSADDAGAVSPSCKEAPGNHKLMRANRIMYLRDIVASFESMGSLSCSPTTRELRLYYKILGHVWSSIWLFLAREMPEETKRRLGEEISGSIDCDSYIPVSETGSSEQQTREHCLQGIVCMIQEIESVFWLSHLSLAEYMLYREILKHIDMDLIQSSYYLKHEANGSTGTGHPEFTAKVALARRVLKTTCEWEVQLASSLEKDIGDTLGMIFAKGPPKESKVTEWLKDHMEDAVCDLKELATEGPQGLELFDNILLNMVEIEKLFGKLLSKFVDANDSAYHALDVENLYQVALMEGWSALRVLESGRFSSEGYN